ncbi:MAG TPA: hypothetical protein VMK32_03700 [Burkholderiaceae bacterium]|nr:hypothetical protein [Burkholderiaceae bacterium]
MNCSANLRIAAAIATVSLAATLALATGCSSVSGATEMEPTVYVAVAPYDLPDDYIGAATVYVPVAPFDLPNDYYTSTEGSDDGEIVQASADAWMVP